MTTSFKFGDKVRLYATAATGTVVAVGPDLVCITWDPFKWPLQVMQAPKDLIKLPPVIVQTTEV